MVGRPGRGRPPIKGRRGFTYLTVMFAVVLIGLAASVAAQQWKTVVKREKEAELLFRGGEIRKAIFAYCATSRPGMLHCPSSLDDLLKDPGSPTARRYIRKLYKDPITNDDWELIKTKDGNYILGVHSKSEEAPLKSGDFPPEFKDFEGKEKYSEWIFECQQLQLMVLGPSPFPTMPTTTVPGQVAPADPRNC
jgi:type II secretory pathway pseudopilin PulG